MPPKPVEIGLSRVRVDEGLLEELALAAEKAVMDSLSRHGRRLSNSNVLVNIEYSGDVLRVNIEVEASGMGLGNVSYDEVVEKAVSEGFKAVEGKLRSLAAEAHGNGSRY